MWAECMVADVTFLVNRFVLMSRLKAAAMVMAEVIIRTPRHLPYTLPRVSLIAYGAYQKRL